MKKKSAPYGVPLVWCCIFFGCNHSWQDSRLFLWKLWELSKFSLVQSGSSVWATPHLRPHTRPHHFFLTRIHFVSIRLCSKGGGEGWRKIVVTFFFLPFPLSIFMVFYERICPGNTRVIPTDPPSLPESNPRRAIQGIPRWSSPFEARHSLTHLTRPIHHQSIPTIQPSVPPPFLLLLQYAFSRVHGKKKRTRDLGCSATRVSSV